MSKPDFRKSKPDGGDAAANCSLAIALPLINISGLRGVELLWSLGLGDAQDLQAPNSFSGKVRGQLQRQKLATGRSSATMLCSSTGVAKDDADEVEAEGSMPIPGQSWTSTRRAKSEAGRRWGDARRGAEERCGEGPVGECVARRRLSVDGRVTTAWSTWVQVGDRRWQRGRRGSAMVRTHHPSS